MNQSCTKTHFCWSDNKRWLPESSNVCGSCTQNILLNVVTLMGQRVFTNKICTQFQIFDKKMLCGEITIQAMNVKWFILSNKMSFDIAPTESEDHKFCTILNCVKHPGTYWIIKDKKNGWNTVSFSYKLFLPLTVPLLWSFTSTSPVTGLCRKFMHETGCVLEESELTVEQLAFSSNYNM